MSSRYLSLCNRARANLDARLDAPPVLAVIPSEARNLSSMGASLRISRHRGFGFSSYDAEPDILGRGRTIRLRIRRTIRAAANHFAFAIARQNQLSHVAAKIVNQLFSILALSMKASNFFQQGRGTIQLLRGFTQFRRILRIRRIPGPVIERVLAIAMFIQFFHFVFIRNSPRLPGFLAEPTRECLGVVERSSRGHIKSENDP